MRTKENNPICPRHHLLIGTLVFYHHLRDDSHQTPPQFVFFSIVWRSDWQKNYYLSSRFFFRNFFVAVAVDDEEDSAVEHVSVVNVSPFRWLGFSIEGNINVGEVGWTNFGIIGNNLISFGRGVWALIKFVEKDVNSDDWDLFFEIFCCFEHQ